MYVVPRTCSWYSYEVLVVDSYDPFFFYFAVVYVLCCMRVCGQMFMFFTTIRHENNRSRFRGVFVECSVFICTYEVHVHHLRIIRVP